MGRVLIHNSRFATNISDMEKVTLIIRNIKCFGFYYGIRRD